MTSVQDALALVAATDAALRRELGIGLRDALVLTAVDGTPARVVAVAAAAGVSVPTASRVLDRLERAGLVRRTTVDGDRRGVAVATTDAGSQVRDRAVEAIRRAASATTATCQAAFG